MTWKKTPPELVEFLDKHLSGFECQRKTMFGFPVYFINNNMFTGAHQDNLFLRLSERDREEILSAYDDVSSFEPMKGRVMKEYVILPDSLIKDRALFMEWLNRSYQYVSSLPPKESKKKAKKKN